MASAMGGIVSQKHLALVTAGLVLAVASLPPIAALAPDLLSSPGAALQMLSSSRAATLLFHSLLIAGGATIVSLVIGVPFGVLVGRFDLIFRRAAWVIHGFPMFVPPFLLALGWFDLLGQKGFASPMSSHLLFSGPGAVMVLSFALSPITTSLVVLSVREIDPSLEEAGLVAAGPWRVATRILVPLSSPAIGLSAVVVFSLAFSELAVPMFLHVDAYPAAVFTRLGGVAYSPGEAAALSLPLVIVAVVLFTLERRISRRRSFATAGHGSMDRAPLPLRRWRIPLSVCAWGITIAGTAPFFGLSIPAAAGFSRVGEWLGAAPVNSVIAASVAATVITGFGVVLGHGLVRHEMGARLFDALAVLGFVLPASVLGVGMIGTWNRAPTQAVYTTLAIITIAFIARYGVLGIRACAAVIAQSPPEMEHAAMVFGAGYLRRLTRVLVPIHARGIAGAWLLVFVFCLRDLEAPGWPSPPGPEPLTVRIFTLEANGPAGVVAALALTQVAMTAAALALGAILLRKTRT